MLGNDAGIENLGTQLHEPHVGVDLVHLHQSGVPDHVCCKDGREAALKFHQRTALLLHRARPRMRVGDVDGACLARLDARPERTVGGSARISV